MEKLLHATAIAEMTDMSKSRVLTLIKKGILPVAKEKEVKFMGKYVTVKFVKENDVNNYLESEEHDKYLESKKKRELKALERKAELRIKAEELRIKAEELRIKAEEKRRQEIKDIIESYGGLTDKLLGEVAYSYSKRAKLEDDREDREWLYSQKDVVLKRYKPLAIHLNKKEITYYDYPDDYYVEYWDREFYKVTETVIDVLEYYEIGEYTFHSPIERLDSMYEFNYKGDLEVKEINLDSKIVGYESLLALDICKYVIKLLKSTI